MRIILQNGVDPNLLRNRVDHPSICAGCVLLRLAEEFSPRRSSQAGAFIRVLLSSRCLLSHIAATVKGQKGQEQRAVTAA